MSYLTSKFHNRPCPFQGVFNHSQARVRSASPCSFVDPFSLNTTKGIYRIILFPTSYSSFMSKICFKHGNFLLDVTFRLISAERVLIAPMTQPRFRTRPILGMQHIQPFLSLCTATVSLVKLTHPGPLQNAAFEITLLMRNDGEGQDSNLTSMKETIPQPLYHLSYFTDSE